MHKTIIYNLMYYKTKESENTVPAPKLNKKITFNDRYKGTPAFSASLLIVKSCGSSKFYDYLCDKISENIHEKPQPVLNDMLINIKKLNPTQTEVDRDTLRLAARSLLDALAHTKENDYAQDIEYEDRHYEEQVIFCMSAAFIFFIEIQAIECAVFQAESQSELIVSNYRKKQELLANTKQTLTFKRK